MRSKKIIVATVAIGLLASTALVAQLERRERGQISLLGQQELVSGSFQCFFTIPRSIYPGGIELAFSGTAGIVPGGESFGRGLSVIDISVPGADAEKAEDSAVPQPVPCQWYLVRVDVPARLPWNLESTGSSSQ